MKCVMCEMEEFVVENQLFDESFNSVPICIGCLAVIVNLSGCPEKKSRVLVKREFNERWANSLANVPTEELYDILEELES